MIPGMVWNSVAGRWHGAQFMQRKDQVDSTDPALEMPEIRCLEGIVNEPLPEELVGRNDLIGMAYGNPFLVRCLSVDDVKSNGIYYI